MGLFEMGLLAQCARADGLYAWGYNAYGQLGDGTTTDRLTPFAVSGMSSGVTDITGGGYHSLAMQNGALYAWGVNDSGELGDGTTTDRHTPVAVSGMTSGVTAITAGLGHSLAVQNGGLYAWGYNVHGQLGDGTTSERHTPVAVSGMGSGVTAIAAGGSHSLAVQNGALYAWGWNVYGELGDGTSTERHTPVAVSGMGSGVTVIAINHYSSNSLAVRNGALYAWGYNYYGQLGDGTDDNNAHSTPALVNGMGSGVTAIAVGYSHVLAVQNGAVYAWGDNIAGALGNGTHDDNAHSTPALVSGLSNIIDVAAASFSSFALAGDGRLWAWGDNSLGELGLGDTTDRLVPTEVFAPTGYKFTSIDGGSGLDAHILATVVTVPEPGSFVLAAFGIVGLAARLGRRRGP